MTITVCIGSGCHVKGSQGIITLLKDYIAANQLDLTVEWLFLLKSMYRGSGS